MSSRSVIVVCGLAAVVLVGASCGKKKAETDIMQLSAGATFQRASELLARRQLRQAAFPTPSTISAAA